MSTDCYTPAMSANVFFFLFAGQEQLRHWQAQKDNCGTLQVVTRIKQLHMCMSWQTHRYEDIIESESSLGSLEAHSLPLALERWLLTGRWVLWLGVTRIPILMLRLSIMVTKTTRCIYCIHIYFYAPLKYSHPLLLEALWRRRHRSHGLQLWEEGPLGPQGSG